MCRDTTHRLVVCENTAIGPTIFESAPLTPLLPARKNICVLYVSINPLYKILSQIPQIWAHTQTW